jgi:hypothetical protein
VHVVGGQPQPTLACLRRPNSYACLLVRAMRPARDETLGHRCSPCVACASVPHALDQLVPHPCQFDHILTCTLGVCMQSNAVTCSLPHRMGLGWAFATLGIRNARTASALLQWPHASHACAHGQDGWEAYKRRLRRIQDMARHTTHDMTRHKE